VKNAILPVLLAKGSVVAQLRGQTPQQNEQYRAQFDRLLDQADSAWDREMTREKAGACDEARTTYNEITCLGGEVESTRQSYKAYAENFRALLGLRAPWTQYKGELCSLASDEYRGGTIAPAMWSRCELQAIRNHMRELGGLLGDRFHH
jgi:uncharacterized protein YecT (DUF1311 family)